MSLLAAFATPLGMMALVLLVARYEARLVAPDERAERIRGLLASPAHPDEIEKTAVDIIDSAWPHRERKDKA
ncbi:hypothetical protein ER308_11400 [Egibacter rhizosphaerae]|uniref:Uncharacterized protein n=1 Tax=Egibacter rhizosphaerae TaxID=1670831 RepID=A0A411YG08_9ACTN|nr:hypothetical protein [Egibacter rhizosphaerae]QBI20109.1 hypothetical protein ER308_11400 [Egibacter rhizosphaerae]